MADKKDQFQEFLSALEKQGEAGEESPLSSSEFRSLIALGQIQSTLQVKFIADQMPGGFFIYRASGDEELVYCNQALIRLFGCNDLEEFKALTGFRFRGLVHADDIEAVESSIWNQVRESQFDLDYVEYRIVQKDGGVRWIEDYGHFVDTEDGGLFYVFVADATEKRQMLIEEKAEALQSVNEELRRRLKIIEGFSIDYQSILYVDLDSDILQPYQLSHRFLAIADPNEPDSFRRINEDYIRVWVHPDDQEAVRRATSRENICERFREDKTFQLTYRVVEDGVPKYLQLRISNVGTDGHISQIVMGYRSVDKEILQEMEQKELLENALARANAAMDAKNTFLSNMSHDLLTPMNAVIGYTALAKKDLNDPDKLTDCLDKIEDAGSRMLQLINGVLELSRIQEGSLESRESACDLDDIISGVEDAIRPMAQAGGIDFDIDTRSVAHRGVYADSRKISRVLVQLLTNAVKYTKPGGKVSLTVSENGAPTRDYANYCFSVGDSGIGIDAEYLDRVFEPFERRFSSTLSGVPGMGLGLTIAKSIVELMGGTLSAESKVGRGSVFTVSLSLRISGALKKEPVSPARAPAAQRRILLVEDNEINRELCAEVLTDAGFEVDTAENGKIALDKVAAAKPGEYTLVLMDIQMPVMDGNEAARAIRALPDPEKASIPIIALSANALEGDRKRSMESGMNAHMAKPIQLGELQRLLDSFS